MRLVIDTWRGININDGVNYIADFPENMPLVTPSVPVPVDMLDMPSLTVGRRLTSATISLFVQPQVNYRDKREELKELFKTEEKFQYYVLTAHDEDDSDRPWYIEAAPLTATPMDDAFIIVLAPKTHYWKSDFAGVTQNFTASGQDKTYNVPISSPFPMYPTLTFTPTVAKAGGYLYQQWLMFKNDRNAVGLVPFNFGNLNTSALVAGGKMRSDGFDLRLLINNAETPRWFGSTFNTGATKIWAMFQMPNTYPMRLAANLGTGALTEIVFKDTVVNRERFKSWPSSGTFVLGTEGFTYTTKVGASLKVTGITRGYRGTTVAAHTATVDLANLQTVDIKLVYGDSLAEDPEYDDALKPLLDLDASTNTSHVFEFFGDTGQRAPTWLYTKRKGESADSREYTGSHDVDAADPYTVAGMKAESYSAGGAWRADTVNMEWNFTPSYKLSTFSVSGEVFKSINSIPTSRVGLRNTAGKAQVLYTIPAPVSINTWTAWSFASGSLSAISIANIYVSLGGSIGGVSGAQFLVEVQEATINYVSTTVPTVANGPEIGSYTYDLAVQNITTGHTITVKRAVRMPPGTIEIDTENHVVRVNGVVSSAGVTPSNTREWFRFDPGNNTIRVTESGLAGMDLTADGSITRGV